MNRKEKLVIEGVKHDADNDEFVFDFNHDDNTDLVKLVADGPYQVKEFVPCTYFGYVFEPDIDKRLKKRFIDLIKYPTQHIQQQDLDRFVNYAVDSLDKKVSLPTYDVIVHPQSSSKLNNAIINAIYDKSMATEFLDFELVKELPMKMEFNYNAYVDMLKQKEGMKPQNIDSSVAAIDRMMADIKKLDYVKIGTYIKAKYRPYIKNFFKFKDNESEKQFKTLQNKKILIVDDVSTTMATLKYVLNAIRIVNDTSDITMFCLLGNPRHE